MRPNRATLTLIALLAACGDSGGDARDAGADTGADTEADTGAGDADAGDADTDDVDPGDVDPRDADPADTNADSGDADADASGDSADTDGDVVVVPDSSVINAYREHGVPAADHPLASEEVQRLRSGDGLPEDFGSIHALRDVDGTILAGADGGLLRFSPDTARFEPAPPELPFTVTAIAERPLRSDGRTFAVVGGGASVTLQPLDGGDAIALVSPVGADLVAVATNGAQVWAAAPGGLWELSSEQAPVADARVAGMEIRDIAVLDDGTIAVASASGLALLPVGAEGATVRFGGVDLTTVSACPGGGLAAGSAGGLHRLSDDGTESTLAAGPGGLPAAVVRAVDCGPTAIALAHPIGATTVDRDTGAIDHYASRRWLPAESVFAAAEGPAGERWFAAAGELTRVQRPLRTLAEKAEHHHGMLEQYFRRLDGFVSAEYVTPDAYTVEGGELHDKDNDGLWTQMMIGAWAFAAEVTADPAYCDAARRSLANMFLLVDIPCVTFSEAGLECGYIARSFVRDDEGPVYESKLSQSNWHPVAWPDGHTYLWKDDTSSDELDGHTFGFPLFFDACATEEERERIARTFADVTDYIIAGDYLLIDLDGERTSHGVWSPAHVSSCVDGFARCPQDFETCGFACFGGGYLNGMQILGQLLVTWHMTGEERYYLEYERLIREHRYDEVITNVDDVMTLHQPAIENHSDHELMMLAYHSLLRYEPNPGRRQRWADAMVAMFETERVERHPLWMAFTAGLTGRVIDRDLAIESLRQMPLDLRKWRVDNSHRADFVLNVARDRFGNPQFVDVPPWDELGYLWFNGNPHAVVQGGSERELQAPTHYLLAYWALRYYGLLGPTE